MSDDLRTDVLIRTYHVPVLFGIELAGKFGGINQIAKHDGELPSFRVGRRCRRERCSLRGWLCLHNGLWCWLSRLRGNCLSACHVTSPDKPPPFVVSHWMHVEEFIF